MRFHSEPSNRIYGVATLPGDKSLSHRALLFAALAEGESVIRNFLVSGVTRAMMECLRQLGVAFTLEQVDEVPCLRVAGCGYDFSAPSAPLDCGNSATTIRLLAGAVAGAGVPCTLSGSAGLCRRPMERIVAPLKLMGADIVSTNGCAPLVVKPAKLHGAEVTLPVASAQVKSCLMLAALRAEGATRIAEPGPSRDHTERMLSAMGAEIATNQEEHTVSIRPLKGGLSPLNVELPGDISSAAFLMVAAATVPDSEITIRNVGLNPTRTGIVDTLRLMGADIETTVRKEAAGEPVGDIVVRYAPLHGAEIGGDLVVRMIDEFPAFAVAAAAAEGTTVVRDAQELRYKETDRIALLCRGFDALGIRNSPAPDGFTIEGTNRTAPSTVEAFRDHRLAMSFALAGLRGAPVTVEGAEIANESFPDFVSKLRQLGAHLCTR